MKTIPLTQGQVALVDDQDFEYLNQWKWYANWHQCTHSFRAERNSSRKNGKHKTIRMHRVIMDAQPGQQVDHRNHDTLDNRRENLRFCTYSENQQNQRPRMGSSKYKGVWWYKSSRKWQTQISLNGHRHHIGYFVDEIEAARAYDNAAHKLFGKFSCTNLPPIRE